MNDVYFIEFKRHAAQVMKNYVNKNSKCKVVLKFWMIIFKKDPADRGAFLNGAEEIPQENQSSI